GKHQSQPGLPQPKLPNHTEPWGATVTPKPAPRMPPPVRGDRGVPLLPSAGWPLGFNTKLKVHEFGEPCVVLFVTHAYPRWSNARFPGPLIKKSGSSLPESLTLTVTVQASGMVTNCGVYKLLSSVNAHIPSTFCQGSRARFARAWAVLLGGAS